MVKGTSPHKLTVVALGLALVLISFCVIDGPDVLDAHDAAQLLVDHLGARLAACNIPLSRDSFLNSVAFAAYTRMNADCGGRSYSVRNINRCATVIDIAPCEQLRTSWETSLGNNGVIVSILCRDIFSDKTWLDAPYLQGSNPLNEDRCPNEARGSGGV